MLESKFENIKVKGIMTAVPGNKERIEEKYSSKFGESIVEQFSKTVGVRERYVSDEKQTASDLAFVAARELLEKQNVKISQIGILVFVTQFPDYTNPATACVLHKRLGLSKDCMAFDVNMGCSGYIYGMQIICSLMNSMNTQYGFLLIGDTASKNISPEDKSAAMLFGDSASAILLEKRDNVDAIRTVCKTDGEGFKSIIVPAGGYRNRGLSHERTIWADGNCRSDYDLYINGVDVFSFSVFEVPDLINAFFKKYNLRLDEFDNFIFHQANQYIIKQIVKKCKLPEDKVPISMDRYGNTSGGSVPLTICDVYGLQADDEDVKLFTCGFGIGLSWGITVFTVNTKDIYQIIETNEYYTEGEVSHD